MSTALLARVERFLARPWAEKIQILAQRFKRASHYAVSRVQIIKRIEPGFLWVMWGDVIREEIRAGNFELAERRFVGRFLRPGMTALDIGAYYGLYTLIASVKVGDRGRVISFEPSPFQRKRLHWHLRLNHCKNVCVEGIALGAVEGEDTLFFVAGPSAGLSSLRRPEVGAEVQPIRVPIVTVDAYLRQHSIRSVDFIKIDVEGGELHVFKGAESLLSRKPRPVILCELQDTRTEAWGHKAKDTAAFIESLGFRWFRPLSDGRLACLHGNAGRDERNFVAVPEERMGQFEGTIWNEYDS